MDNQTIQKIDYVVLSAEMLNANPRFLKSYWELSKQDRKKVRRILKERKKYVQIS